MKKNLRSGYTTGACAAAAAKAATILLLQNTAPPTYPSPSPCAVNSATTRGERGEGKGGGENLGSEIWALGSDVEIPFPDGSRVSFKVHSSQFTVYGSDSVAQASVIKDAGDDPDVTNGAEIMAEIVMRNTLCVMGNNIKKETLQSNSNKSLRITNHASLIVKGGKGVGLVTKPGLPVPVGEPAINPVPRRMIKDAVMEAVSECGLRNGKCGILKSAIRNPHLEVTISVPDGESLAKKTLNLRLGIIGGISILGTTGIVKPISSEAWTATITLSMDVTKAVGLDEVVLSAGRASEKAHMKKNNLPEEAYVLMGDYLGFALLEAKKHGFKKIHLCAQWAKMLKIAMATPQTHVKHGALDIKKAVKFLKNLEFGILIPDSEFNTAREIFDFIQSAIRNPQSAIFSGVCSAAKKYVEGITSGIPVIIHLIAYGGEIIASSE
ncbi:MAG: cobalt-precorrin-5B (C(1))-methyltransferase CbiD [Nitrospirota bacterium]